MTLPYLQQNLSLALSSMAASSKPLAKRLVDVFPYHVSKLPDESFPLYLREKFTKLCDEYRDNIVHIGDVSILQVHPRKARRMIEVIGNLEFEIVTEIAYPERRH